MADIKRTLNELLTSFTDNNSQDITPNDIRNLVKSVYGNEDIIDISSDTTINSENTVITLSPIDNTLVITIPSANSNDLDGSTYKGKIFSFINLSSFDISLTSSTGFNKTLKANDLISIISNGSNWVIKESSNVNLTTNKLDKVDTTPQSVASPVDFDGGILVESGYFGASSPNIVFDASATAYILDNPGVNLTIQKTHNNSAFASLTLSKASPVDGVASLSSNGAGTSFSSINLLSGSATTQTYQQFTLENTDGGTVGGFTFTGSGLDIQNPNPTDGSGIKMPNGSWIRPQTENASLYFTNGVNPSDIYSSVHLNQGQLKINGGNGVSNLGYLQIVDGQISLQVVDSSTGVPKDSIVLGDGNIELLADGNRVTVQNTSLTLGDSAKTEITLNNTEIELLTQTNSILLSETTGLTIDLPSKGANKVLTSDLNGFATWQTPTVFGQVDSVVGGTNVTIDNADPINPIVNVANVDLQTAYNNSTTPEILTDATNGALTLKRGSALDTDNIFEGKNGAGTTTSRITGEGGATFNDDIFVTGVGRFNNSSNSLKLAVGFNDANDSNISLYKNTTRIGSVKSRGGAFSLVADTGNTLELDGDTINALSRILQGSVTDDGSTGGQFDSIRTDGGATFGQNVTIGTSYTGSFPLTLRSAGSNFLRSEGDNNIGWSGKKLDGTSRFFFNSSTGSANNFFLDLFSLDGATSQDIFKATYDANFEIYRNLEATQRILQGSVTDDASTGIQAESLRIEGESTFDDAVTINEVSRASKGLLVGGFSGDGQTNEAVVRLMEGTAVRQYLGGYIKYNGAIDTVSLGHHPSIDSDPTLDVDFISFSRIGGKVTIHKDLEATQRILQGSVTDDGTTGIIAESLKVEGQLKSSLGQENRGSNITNFRQMIGGLTAYGIESTDADSIEMTQVGMGAKLLPTTVPNSPNLNGSSYAYTLNFSWTNNNSDISPTLDTSRTQLVLPYSTNADGSIGDMAYRSKFSQNSFGEYRYLVSSDANGNYNMSRGRILQGSVTDDTSTGIQAESLRSDGDVKADTFTLDGLNTAPTSQTDTGTIGEQRWDENYHYLCTATNFWKRTALDSTAW